jgi:response regulator RpfG family c-di-GMP phosphodiesterase
MAEIGGAGPSRSQPSVTTKDPSKTVAVVDDSPLALAITRRALEGPGVSVQTAGNIAELEGVIACASPDLILVDVNMPEMFGDDVVMVLKRVRRVAIPIWLFSHTGEADLAGRARHAGADGFVSKAFGIQAVVDRVHAFLGVRP